MKQTLQIRPYHIKDTKVLVELFYRSVYEIACRDYTLEQLEAWAPKPPDYVLWQHRLQKERVFVGTYEGNIQGFILIEPTGHIDLL